MLKTKFEITMNVEVADVDGLPISSESICNSVSKSIENIYMVEPIDIRILHVSRTGRVKVNITPKVIHSTQ